MFTIASTPAKQSVSETITTLSGRLSSSTLLEDRRAAILGLRSFAKEYPASVASDSLRGLIGSLSKDGEDVDTVKIVLETLLMLFNPNENSPEASEEIALWLADEFTQRQDNITLLLDFLDTNDFYSRLYSLQLLSAILSSRTERTEECILTAPLGISRLVAVLDETRDAVRNEGLSLLSYLTPNSFELQKVVAYENAFDRIFNIIKLEGSLSQGDRVVEDCLILLANLLRLNVSNQSFFRETGCVPKLARLLHDAVGGKGVEEEVAEWAKAQKNRNIYALLAVLRLFLITGGVGTQANQASFWQHGVLSQVLQLAFSRSTEMQIKAEVCAFKFSTREAALINLSILGVDNVCGFDSGQSKPSRRIRTITSHISTRRASC
jgi:intracellular protein transport protein USO1